MKGKRKRERNHNQDIRRRDKNAPRSEEEIKDWEGSDDVKKKSKV